MKDPGSHPQTAIEGHIERVTFHNTSNLFTIARLTTEHPSETLTILGYIPSPHPGQKLALEGQWERHAQFGRQFRFNTYQVFMPVDSNAIQRYLASGVVKGVGPKLAARLVEHLGEKTLDVIANQPDTLQAIPGIGKQTATKIYRNWQALHEGHQLYDFLKENGVPLSFAARLVKTYGEQTLHILQTDPLRVIRDIPQDGLKIAEGLLRDVTDPAAERERAAAGLQYLLQETADAGHLCVPLEQLLKRGEQFLSVSAETASRALEALRSLQEIVVDDQTEIPVVYLTALFEAEATIIRRLKAFLTVPVPEQRWDRHDLALELVQSLAIELTAEQLATLDSVLTKRIAIITGGPGTGKTTLIRALTRIYEYLGRRVKLAAPTGRAARHLSGLTARSATTVHRLLRYNPANNRFEKNVHSPVDTDVIIVDEASMMDVPLTSHLLQAMHPQMTLILVGDVDQLPSVGPGNLLADLIHSGAIPAFVLKTIHRQVAESSIVQAAHRIRRGKPPILPDSERLDHQTEFIFLNSSRPEQAQRLIVELCQKSIPDIFGYHSVRDVQVVTPMHKGPVGTMKLNQILQEALNHNPVALQTQGRIFKHNDKVMHLVNNYAKGVFNGEIGRITTIDNANDALAVEYDGNAITYHFSEVNELTLAYAITVHKSQGSEYPVVILPMVTQHRPLLQRNLLYTAVTRAQKLVVLVGSQRAFRIALDNDKPQTRFSFLAQRLASTPS